MELQAESGNSQPLTLQLEFVSEDEHDADPAAVGEVSRSVVAALKKDGYAVHPVYTGERGDFLFAIPLVLEFIGQALLANKDLLLEWLKAVQPVIEYVFKEREKKASAETAQGQVKIAVEIDGDSLSVEAPDVESTECLVKLADRFRATHSSVAEEVTPQSQIKIRGSVPKRQQRRRR